MKILSGSEGKVHASTEVFESMESNQMFHDFVGDRLVRFLNRSSEGSTKYMVPDRIASEVMIYEVHFSWLDDEVYITTDGYTTE